MHYMYACVKTKLIVCPEPDLILDDNLISLVIISKQRVHYSIMHDYSRCMQYAA